MKSNLVRTVRTRYTATALGKPRQPSASARGQQPVIEITASLRSRAAMQKKLVSRDPICWDAIPRTVLVDLAKPALPCRQRPDLCQTCMISPRYTHGRSERAIGRLEALPQ